MSIFVGLTSTGTLDIDFIKRYGVSSLDDPATSPDSEKNARFRDALASACDIWQRHTGRSYLPDAPTTRQISKYYSDNQLKLPDAASQISLVEVFNTDTGAWDEVETSRFSAVKLRSGRGEVDTVFAPHGWRPGIYRVTALWGELTVPEFVRFHAIKLATHLWQFSDNLSGSGSTISIGEEMYQLDQSKIPFQVWDAMNRDKRPSLAFRERQ